MEKTMQDIIIRPIVTEASMAETSAKKYTFEVAKTAGKPEIREAVEKLFDVTVAKVNTMNVRGRFKTQGRTGGYTASWKKAIVTLTADSKTIAFFDGLM